jgi:WhiB family transcriptional regulator, redox-sensing transcriptional regulator
MRRPGFSDHPLTFAGRSERQQRGDEFLAARLVTAGYWRSAAACRSADPELFFPISHAGPALEQVADAKAICAACPVQRECLAFALQTEQVHGIWGGMTEQERAARRRSSQGRRL